MEHTKIRKQFNHFSKRYFKSLQVLRNIFCNGKKACKTIGLKNLSEFEIEKIKLHYSEIFVVWLYLQEKRIKTQ